MRMMSDDDVSTTSFKTRFSQELTMIQQENRMRIINTIMRQE